MSDFGTTACSPPTSRSSSRTTATLADPPARLPAHGHTSARARLQGDRDHHHTFDGGRRQRHGPLPPGHGRHRPRTRPRRARNGHCSSAWRTPGCSLPTGSANTEWTCPEVADWSWAGSRVTATPTTWDYDHCDPAEERLRDRCALLSNGYSATRGALPECVADDVHYPGTYVAGAATTGSPPASPGREVEARRERGRMVNPPELAAAALPGRRRGVAHAGHRRRTRPPPDRASGLGRAGAPHPLRARQGTCAVRAPAAPGAHGSIPISPRCARSYGRLGARRDLDVEAALDGRCHQLRGAATGTWRPATQTHVHTGSADDGTVWLRRRYPAPRTSGSAWRPARRPTRRSPRHGNTCRSRQRDALRATPEAAPSPSTRWWLCTPHATRRSATRCRPPSTGWPDAPGFDELLVSHRTAWGQLWRRAELEVPGEAGSILRLHLFHVLQTLSPHTADLRRGRTGPRAARGGVPGGMSSGTSCSSCPYLNLHFPGCPRPCSTTGTAASEVSPRAPRPRDRQARRAVPVAERQRRTRGDQQLHLNPHLGPLAAGPPRTSSTMWGRRSRTTCGSTARRAATRSSCTPRVPRCCCRSRASGRTPPPGTSTWEGAPHQGRRRPRRVPRGLPRRRASGPRRQRAYTNVTAAWVLSRTLEVLADLPEPRRRELVERTALHDGELEQWRTSPAPSTCPSTRASSASSTGTATSPNSTGRACAGATATSGASTASWRPRTTASTTTRRPSRPTY